MRLKQVFAPLAFALVPVLASCGAPQEDVMLEDPTQIEVMPQDFAVGPCLAAMGDVPCLIVQAGGKAVLIGAPEGAMSSLFERRVDTPDIVFLPDLLPGSLDGLLRLRNATWANGRQAPLPVIGPAGTAEIIAYLNAALVIPDAELFAVEPPLGGFEAALIAGAEAPPMSVFDTGDLRVDAKPTPSGIMEFDVRYGGLHLRLGTCDASSADQPEADLVLLMRCDGGTRSYVWPFEETVLKLTAALEE